MVQDRFSNIHVPKGIEKGIPPDTEAIIECFASKERKLSLKVMNGYFPED